MEFEEYLLKKKINAQGFRKAEPAMWKEWEELFAQIHPDSFTQQKLFLINPIRRRFPLKPTVGQEEKPKAKAARPVMKPKPKKS
jgi:hypothetical protein